MRIGQSMAPEHDIHASSRLFQLRLASQSILKLTLVSESRSTCCSFTTHASKSTATIASSSMFWALNWACWPGDNCLICPPIRATGGAAGHSVSLRRQHNKHQVTSLSSDALVDSGDHAGKCLAQPAKQQQGLSKRLMAAADIHNKSQRPRVLSGKSRLLPSGWKLHSHIC